MEQLIISKITELQTRLQLGPNLVSDDYVRAVPWNWVVAETMDLLQHYSSGVSEAILLSHLQCKWDKEKNIPAHSDPTRYGITSLRSLTQGNSLYIPSKAVLYLTITCIATISPTTIQLAHMKDRTGESEISLYIPSRFNQLPPEFTINRNIRVTGSKLVHASLYNNRILPTDLVVFELSEKTDSHFIDDKTITPLHKLNADEPFDSLWLFTKIIKISSEKRNHKGSSARTIEIVLEDQFDNMIPFILFDDQIPLSYIFKKTDILLLHNPGIPVPEEWGKRSHLLYGTKTVMYLLQSDESDGSGPLLSRYNFRFDLPTEQGNSGRQTFINEIKAHSENISFFAICTDVGPNLPTPHNHSFLARRLITCGDVSQETFNITSWGDLAIKAATIAPGQLLFFHKLRTTEQRSNGTFFTNCWKQNQSELFNLNAMSGILESPFFSSRSTLRSGIRHQNFVSQACIVGWIEHHSTFPPVSHSHHSVCCRKLTVLRVDSQEGGGEQLECKFCKVKVTEKHVVSLINMEWKIDDDSGNELVVRALPMVQEQILEYKAFDFASKSQSERNRILSDCLNKEFIFLLSSQDRKKYRIDLLSQPKYTSPFKETLDSKMNEKEYFE